MSKAPQSFKVATTLTAYRMVRISAGNTVAYCTATSDIPIGITLNDVKEITQALPVAGPGDIAKLYFSNSVAAGSLVMVDSGAAGQGKLLAATTAGVWSLGILIGNKVNDVGTLGDVLIMPTWQIID